MLPIVGARRRMVASLAWRVINRVETTEQQDFPVCYNGSVEQSNFICFHGSYEMMFMNNG
jgi:hypothetical protein